MSSVRTVTGPIEEVELFAADVEQLVQDGWKVSAVGFDRGVFAAVLVAPDAMSDVTAAPVEAETAEVADDSVDEPAVSPLGSTDASGDDADEFGLGEINLDGPEDMAPAVGNDDVDDDAVDEFALGDIDLGDDVLDDEDDDEDAPAATSSGADPAGWYDDPSGRNAQRYWTGSAWSEHVADDDGNQSIDPPIA